MAFNINVGKNPTFQGFTCTNKSEKIRFFLTTFVSYYYLSKYYYYCLTLINILSSSSLINREIRKKSDFQPVFIHRLSTGFQSLFTCFPASLKMRLRRSLRSASFARSALLKKSRANNTYQKLFNASLYLSITAVKRQLALIPQFFSQCTPPLPQLQDSKKIRSCSGSAALFSPIQQLLCSLGLVLGQGAKNKNASLPLICFLTLPRFSYSLILKGAAS